MKSNKYTLDRIEEGFAVLLQHLDENNQLLIPITSIDVQVKEGDLVLVDARENDEGYDVTVLKEETKVVKDSVNKLIEKLKNK